jgi:ABC-type multidrug transport system fused ATPase/permease subunit
MKIVQIFGKEKAKLKAFDEINDGLLKANLKELIVFGIYRPSMYLIYVIGLGIVLGYGGYQVIHHMLTIGVLVIYLQYISNFFDPIQQLAEQFNILQSAFAAAEKIFSLLDEEPENKTIIAPKVLDQVEGRIEFRNVSFAYVEDEYVLKDISFSVEPGETVAFVGATGAGKTSILNLLSRYYEIQHGEILLDGHNIKKLDPHSIRAHVGQMLQDVFLFTGDIKENIRLGDTTITEEAIVEAAKTVNAHHFIEKLPDHYDAHVYERGSTFSAGQRQLLSFARTLAYKPSVLVLDEATANIDTETEVLIQDALLKLMEGRTTLVVAHRLSTIQHADKIVVLHKGRIKEIGNHQTLLNKKGLYYNLYQLQYQELEA